MKKSIIIFIGILVYLISYGQEVNSFPKGWKTLKEDKLTAVYQLPAIDINALKQEDKINDKLAMPWRFGYQHQVDFGLENGQWSDLQNGDKIWRLKITSKGALSLNLIFDEFYLPEGSELYIYDESRNFLLGRYTSKENQESNRFGTWLIESDNLIIEYYEPSTVKELVKLHVESATHGYRNSESFKNEKALNDGGDCNLDVDCSIGIDWDPIKELNKKSVGILISGGSSFCSGALINNTANDGKPYFLTADHCYSNPANWSFRFEWISPTAICASTIQSQNGPTTKTISGATLRARNSNTDFCLVEINSAIPTAWDLTWAGWDKSDVIPDYVVGIHHPRGDVMKVCRDDSGPIKAVNAGAQTWEITTAGDGWEMGVTEGGSSGSPLFDQSGRIIGQLYGGGAACSGIVDNGSFDYYGRLGISWDGASSSERLKDWLDPSNSNVNTTESFPPLQTYSLDASTTVTFPAEVDCGQSTTTSAIKLRNNGTSNLTSATITWTLNSGSVNTVNWVGNLAQNQTEDIQLGVLNSPNGVFDIDASVSSPNLGIDEFPGNDASSNTFTLIANGFQTAKVFLDLTTDDYSGETTWEFRNVNGSLIKSGGPYALNNTIYLDSVNVLVDECYEFEIFDSQNDGICCVFGNGSYTLKTDNNTVIKQGGDFGASELTEISITGSVGIKNKNEKTTILLFPNPVNNELNIQISNAFEFVNYEILNSIGQRVLSGGLIEKQSINVSFLSKGIYFVKVINKSGSSEIQKFIKK